MAPNSSALDEFLVEAKEHLDAIEEDLLAAGVEGATATDEQVRRVFRAIHTIKGNAGFFGFKRTATLAHAMETLLALARAHKVVLGPTHVDGLLHCVDVLRALLDDAETSDGPDIAVAMARVAALVERGEP